MGSSSYPNQQSLSDSGVLKNYSEYVKAHGNVGASLTIDFNDGNVQTLTLTANCTITITNSPASGRAGSMVLIISQDATGSRTITWPAAVKWPGATAPTLTTTASKRDVITLFTVDGGTSYLGALAGANYA